MENDTTFLYGIVGKEKMLTIKTVSINDMDKQTTKEKKTTTQILKR
jgi:hypothetical protein